MDKQLQNPNVRLAITFIIGVLVGVGGYKLWLNGADGGPASLVNDDTNATSTPELVTDGLNGLAVGNQTAGDKVLVTQVVFRRPGWVVIHDNNNGVPGRILGARLFDVGTSTGEVELLRATEDNRSYIAVLNNDDGDYRKFNMLTDRPILDEGGNKISTIFDVGPIASIADDGLINITNPIKD